jgi:tetratricopeptide (TPR) repeat protein
MSNRPSEVPDAPSADAFLTEARPWNRWDWLAGVLVFLAAAGPRLGYWLTVRGQLWFQNPIIDSDHFHKWAQSILHGNFLGTGTFAHGPLYAYLLAGVYALLGPDPARAAGLQLLLGAVCCVLIYALARRFFSLPVALAAGLGQAVYGLAFFHEGTLLTVVLINFLNLCLLLAVYWAARRRAPARWIVPGVFLGLSFLSRPSIGLFLAVLFAWLAWLYLRADRKFALRAAVFLGASMALVVLPATVRNAVVLHEWMISVPHGGMNFYIGNARQAKGYHVILDNNAGLNADKIAERFKQDAEAALGRKLTYAEASAYWMGKAWREIFDDLGHWQELLLTKFLLFFNHYEYTTSLNYYAVRELTPFLKFPWLSFKWVAPLALLGMVWLRRRFRELFPLYGFALVVLAGNVAIMVSSEYRYAVMPVFFIFAAQGGVELVALARNKTWLRLGAALGLVLMFFALVSMEMIGKNERDYHLASAHSNFGHLLARLDNFQGASEEYGMAKDLVKFQPQYLSSASEELAATYIQLQRWDEARQELEEANTLSPNVVSVIDELGTVATAQGRFPEAIDLRKQALVLAPGEAKLHLNLGMTYLWAGQDRDADRELAEALRLSPELEKYLAEKRAVVLRNRKPGRGKGLKAP